MKHNNKAGKTVMLAVLAISAVGFFSSPAYAEQEATEKAAEITMDDIINANTGEKVLEVYDSYLVDARHGDMIYYADREMRYIDYGDYQMASLEDESSYIHITEGDTYKGLLNGRPGLFNIFENPFFDVEFTRKETILETKTENDTLIVKTEMVSDDAKAAMEIDGYEYTEGDYFSYEYCLDKDTHILNSSVTTLCHVDGSSEEYSSLDVKINGERPDMAQKLYDRLTSSDRQKVTVILNPDTEEEVSYSTYTIKGETVIYLLPDGYSQLYSDKECTEKSTGGIDEIKDTVYYSVADEQ